MMDTYNSGYTKALLDVREFFESHSDTFNHLHLFTVSGVNNVLDALIENRDEMRETGTVEGLIVESKTKKIHKQLSFQDLGFYPATQQTNKGDV